MKLIRLNWDETFCPRICLEKLEKERQGFWKYAHADVQPNQGFFIYSTRKNRFPGIVAIGTIKRKPRCLEESEIEEFKLNYMENLNFRTTKFIEISILDIDLDNPLLGIEEISSYFEGLGNFALQGSCALPEKAQAKAAALFKLLSTEAGFKHFEKELGAVENALESMGSSTEVFKSVIQRVGQAWLRQQLLSIHNNTCQISGVAQPDLLVCSHIIPWSIDKANRLNPNNALLLAFNYDFLFDKGYISFDNDGKILISERLDGDYGIKRELKLQEISEETKKFLTYHRNNIFIK